MGANDRRLRWIGTSLDDLRAFPPEVQSRMGFALRAAQEGSMDPDAKVLHGFGNAGVVEVAERFARNAYRAVYTVRLEHSVYVLHVFQKKSKSGIATSTPDVDTIRRRLREAEMLDAAVTAKQRGSNT
ncbi:MAG: type II toxin-antitoxin system RelE/ParE family toxin [Thermomicrobiales bacterium]